MYQLTLGPQVFTLGRGFVRKARPFATGVATLLWLWVVHLVVLAVVVGVRDWGLRCDPHSRVRSVGVSVGGKIWGGYLGSYFPWADRAVPLLAVSAGGAGGGGGGGGCARKGFSVRSMLSSVERGYVRWI